MIVVVKINRCIASGGSVAACAYRAWRLTGLLTNHTLRNQCKYLIAMNGPKIEGIFCIQAVAPDHLHAGRVQFDLKPVNDKCYATLENLLEQYNERTNKTRYIQGAGYIRLEELNLLGIEIPKLACCDYANIPVVHASEIQQMERPNL